MSAVFGAWRQVEQGPVLVALQELIEALYEPRHGRRVGLADAVDVGAQENQAAGAALAVGGGEARLGAADLTGEGGALSALGLLERCFFAVSSCVRAACRARSCCSSSCGSILVDGSIATVYYSNTASMMHDQKNPNDREGALFPFLCEKRRASARRRT